MILKIRTVKELKNSQNNKAICNNCWNVMINYLIIIETINNSNSNLLENGNMKRSVSEVIPQIGSPNFKSNRYDLLNVLRK
jgi:hypothetical protein